MEYFGEWINDKDLKKKFKNNKPFPYVIIENFLNKDFLELISNEFPNDYSNWNFYNNPLEVKYAKNDLDKLNNIKKLFHILGSKEITDLFSEISGIDNLENDPTLHGCGLHAHPRNGRLAIHLDYEKHPILINKERRLNLILYISKDWDPSWNGETELWDNEKCISISNVKYNNAILFQTNDNSWHGIPKKINCPEDIFRKTIAFYYISDIVSKEDKNKIGNNGSGYRVKATYKNTNEPDPRIDKLIKIRPLRLITKEDINDIWPEWNAENN